MVGEEGRCGKLGARQNAYGNRVQPFDILVIEFILTSNMKIPLKLHPKVWLIAARNWHNTCLRTNHFGRCKKNFQTVNKAKVE